MSRFRPPAGYTFYCSDRVLLMVLAHDLRRVATFLQASWPYASINLFADWWEHDGLHFDQGVITFHTLFNMIGSPRTIYEAMPGDDDVRVGVAPSNGEWYLCFYATWDDDGKQLEGDYDLTLPMRLVERFRAEVQLTLSAPLEEDNAASYFNTIIL